jgi:electron transport complex protein RnfG
MRTVGDIIKLGIRLFIICAASAVLLSGVNSFTQPKIQSHTKSCRQTGLREIMPEALQFEPVKKDSRILYYKGLDVKGNLVGYVFEVSTKGYSSIIEALVAVSSHKEIMGIKILYQNETPGIGTRILKTSFLDRFKGVKVAGLSDIDTISGATISSKAVIKAIKEISGEIQNIR